MRRCGSEYSWKHFTYTLLSSIDVISERFNRVEYFKMNFLVVINSHRMQILWPSLMMRTTVLFQIALKEHIPSSPDNLKGKSYSQFLVFTFIATLVIITICGYIQSIFLKIYLFILVEILVFHISTII